MLLYLTKHYQTYALKSQHYPKRKKLLSTDNIPPSTGPNSKLERKRIKNHNKKQINKQTDTHKPKTLTTGDKSKRPQFLILKIRKKKKLSPLEFKPSLKALHWQAIHLGEPPRQWKTRHRVAEVITKP